MSLYTPEEITKVLDSSTDRNELLAAATELARSDDPRELVRLGDNLTRAKFLSRLDNLDEPTAKTAHLKRVLEPLISRPSAHTADLCLRLADDPVFMADPDRLLFLLRGLAAVRPMSEAAAALFRRTNDTGYFAINASLLVRNGSPRALALFESMIASRDQPVERRVDCLHMAVMPNRTNLPVLQMCERLLRHDLENEVAIGVVESVYDFQPEPWFDLHGPEPPAWRSASSETLQFAIDFAGTALAVPSLPEGTRSAVEATVRILRALVARRP
jgi:hypothetical protein